MRTLHVAGLPESQIDDAVGRFEKLENPVVGLAAYPGVTDVRITARGASEAEALAGLGSVEADIRTLLGAHVIGIDRETLAGAALGALPGGGSLVSTEWGTGGALAALLSAEKSAAYLGGAVLPEKGLHPAEMESALSAWQSERGATCALGVRVARLQAGYRAEFLIQAKDLSKREQRLFLVSEDTVAQWGANTALVLLLEVLRGKSVT
jgi:hypothetical protein